MTEQEIKLQIAEVAGTWVAAISVVIGGLFGIYQYLEHKSAVRVDRSMAFVERYQGNSTLVAARVKITQSQEKHTGELNQILQDPALSAVQLSTKYENEIIKQIEEEKLNGALEQLFTFYEQIILCREMELCDEDVAKQFFDTNAQDLVNTYYPYICKIRSEWHNPKQYQKITELFSPQLVC